MTKRHSPRKLRIARVIHAPLSKRSRQRVLNMLVGFGLLLIGINAFLEETPPDYEGYFKLHHAIILIGVATLLHGLIKLAERLDVALEEHDKHVDQPQDHDAV